jgi:secernin
MCDTIVIVEPDRVFFAKNSDRDANEGQNLVGLPARMHEPGAHVRCTYIEIPEARETHAVLLSQPFWMWGAEMGANSEGVVIGNEAVFTREPYAKEPALLGMDLLRLGLERGATAKQAVEVIVELLETHGQGGGCGHESKKFTYHNSFLIADPREAYVLETAGKNWETERIASGPRTISNGLTIPGFRETYSDFVNTRFSDSKARQCRTTDLAKRSASVADLMRLLQDHGEGRDAPHYAWINGAMAAPCMHAGGTLAASQSTASWVSELRGDGCAHWATATAAPCLSLFKPVGVDTPVDYPHARDTADDSLWWRHERLHRAVMRNPAELRPLFIAERDAVQQRWLDAPPPSAEAFAEADRLLEEWTARVLAQNVPDLRPGFVRRYWAKRNARAGLSLATA